MLDKFKINFFLNGLVVSISEVLPDPVCYFLIGRVKRRLAALISFTGTIIFSAILLFIWDQNSEEALDISESIGILTIIFLFRFIVSA